MKRWMTLCLVAVASLSVGCSRVTYDGLVGLSVRGDGDVVVCAMFLEEMGQLFETPLHGRHTVGRVVTSMGQLGDKVACGPFVFAKTIALPDGDTVTLDTTDWRTLTRTRSDGTVAWTRTMPATIGEIAVAAEHLYARSRNALFHLTVGDGLISWELSLTESSF